MLLIDIAVDPGFPLKESQVFFSLAPTGDTMRFLTTTVLFFVAVLTCGCRSNTTSLQCERETALLRAEILDLEDKYYALKSQYESSPIAGSTTVTNAGYVGSGVITSQAAPVYVDSQTYGTPMVHGEVIQGGVIQGGVIQGDVIYEDQMLPQGCLLYTSPSPRDQRGSRMPSSA